MNSFAHAVQNILRNRRRSSVTAASVAVGAAAVLLLSGFLLQLILSYQTVVVQSRGHLTIYRAGFYDFGSGDPAAYGISNYETIIRRIQADPKLRPLVNAVTPTQEIFGIASYEPSNRSRIFVGTGLIPSEQDLMRAWDDYKLGIGRSAFSPEMRDNLLDRGFIGPGLARILGLCTALHLRPCPKLPKTTHVTQAENIDRAEQTTIRALEDIEKPNISPAQAERRVDLMAATANGAPNVVSLNIVDTQTQGFKALDDSAVIMTLPLAQQLVYGRGVHAVSSIVVQLHHSSDLALAQQALAHLLKHDHLEIFTYEKLDPLYRQIEGLYFGIFIFVVAITGIVALFSIVNTVSINVIERTREIGTLRALGMRRAAIRRQFLFEGLVLGALGATLGIATGLIIAFFINRLHFSWTPPGASHAIPFHVVESFFWLQVFGPWALLVFIAGLASISPAGKAARKNVVSALRHV